MFSSKENLILRKILRDMRERNRWSQTKVGDLLGIGQQAAGTILNKNGGFGRETANKLAELCGFENAEAMLEDVGKRASADDAPKGSAWFERDMAIAHATRLRIDAKAIDRVVAVHAEPEDARHPMKWWIAAFIDEETGRRAVPKAPASSPAVEPKAKPKQRRKTA